MKIPETTDKTTDENTDEPPTGSGPIVPKKFETAKEDLAIPSQADIFRSVAEQLNITKSAEAKGGTPLEGIINFVERPADLDDLNSLWNAGQAK